MLQVLQPIFDPTFSESSFGFRPGRSAHQAVQAAQGHITDGHRWVIDMDLEKFFDRVNHDVLMARLARRIEDKRILKVVRAYLQAGMMDNGVATPRDQGTPQGGPISPLLSNVLLDELDRELERRGHRFARYADDCNIYVRSKRAGRRVLDSITRYLETRLRLQVNDEKSSVDRPWNRTFLGYSFTWHRNPKPKVAPASVRRFKQNLKEVFRWGRGRNIRQTIRHIVPKIRGWVAYFKLSEVKNVFERLDRWIRRRLRCILWRQWKRPKTRYRKLMACGLSASRAAQSAGNGHGPWWNAGASHMNYAVTTKRLRRCGLISLIDEYQRLEP
jgi:group II intron reverse transcriptase/maturase